MPSNGIRLQETCVRSSTVSSVTPTISDQIGAVVLGGDYQGLGIVRSLGRRGVPICVIDDEHSIARFSRFVRYWVRVPSLRREEKIVQVLLETERRLGLQGRVVYPTRDEMVAALSRHREELSRRFRIPNACWPRRDQPTSCPAELVSAASATSPGPNREALHSSGGLALASRTSVGCAHHIGTTYAVGHPEGGTVEPRARRWQRAAGRLSAVRDGIPH